MQAADPSSVAAVRRRLLAFFDERARDLPWRATDDPYRIWISEVMLQQTRVGTVVPYYERWVERFPTVEALADASGDEVLKAWEGLGYYSRARNLHRAAAVVRERHGGRLPDTAEELRELPGVGEYTAGAVASIAFGRALPAVDGNVRRVLARLYDLEAPRPAELRERAAALVDPERPGDFNQALMELGATVCVPRGPLCPECPLEGSCLARARGTVEERPPARTRGPVPERTYAVALVLTEDGGRPDGARTLLTRRGEEGLLAGLWEFPAVGIGEGEGAADAALDVARRHGVERPEPGVPLGEVRHAFSHLRAVYRPVLVRARMGAEVGGDRVARPPVAGLDRYAMPRAQRALARRLRSIADRTDQPREEHA